jgi:hypothetical protein
MYVFHRAGGVNVCVPRAPRYALHLGPSATADPARTSLAYAIPSEAALAAVADVFEALPLPFRDSRSRKDVLS